MNNEKLVLEIYNKTINEVLKGIDEKYYEELRSAYMEYLKRNYLSFDLNKNNKKPEEIAVLFTQLENSKWINSKPGLKLSELLRDPAFENIKYISNMGYKYAREMLDMKFKAGNAPLQPVIDEEKAKESIEMLNNNYEQVREFNKMMANYFISEGSLDFQYASGITEHMSLRIGDLVR